MSDAARHVSGVTGEGLQSGRNIPPIPGQISARVSRETSERLTKFAAVFDQWQRRINLVSPSTMDDFWNRHVADSLQLLDLAPSAESWLDLGSGGGFPGLVVASARTSDPKLKTILVESNGKKAAFLREASRIAGISADIRADRLETVLPNLPKPVSVVSACALAPLDQLVTWTAELLKTGTLGLFLKGRDARSELAALECPAFLNWKAFPSTVDPQSQIIALWNPDQCAEPGFLPG
jgi:16S rRNA (guanine527-N7)-methyltransferase